MPDPVQSEVLRELAAIRQELRFVRWLLVSVSLVFALLLFVPSWVARIVEWGLSFGEFVIFALGMLAVIVVAAFVVSHRSPAPPAIPPRASGGPIP